MRRPAGAVAVGLLVVGGLAATGRPVGAGWAWRLAFVVLHGASLWALWAWLRGASLTARQLVAGAVLLRLAALPMAPSLSDDGYRHLWDGRVQAELGESPYRYRPSAPEVAPADDGVLLRRMNSPDYFSVYPPASQAVFRAAVALSPVRDWRAEWAALKLLLVLAEGAGIALLARAVGPTAAALYAWSPLAVVEVAGQGHTEALVVLGFGLVVAPASSRVPWRSVGVTVAGLAKLWPLALLPLAWRRDGWPGVAASAGLATALTAAVATAGGLGHAAESLGLFFGTFDEYALPYRLLKSALFPALGPSAGRAASGALAVAFAGVAAWQVAGDDGTPAALRRAAVAVTAAFALTTATLHPWYLVPVLFVVPLLQRHTPTMLLVTGATAMYLAYEVPAVAPVVLWAGWGSAAVALGLSRRRATGGPPRARRPPSR